MVSIRTQESIQGDSSKGSGIRRKFRWKDSATAGKIATHSWKTNESAHRLTTMLRSGAPMVGHGQTVRNLCDDISLDNALKLSRCQNERLAAPAPPTHAPIHFAPGGLAVWTHRIPRSVEGLTGDWNWLPRITWITTLLLNEFISFISCVHG